MPNVFVDMDGVLADFERHYRETFGLVCSKALDNVDWALVKNKKHFYAHIPPMEDFRELWDGIIKLTGVTPTVLTGVPHDLNVPEAPANKTAWKDRHLGPEVPIICCHSKDKCLHAKPGDILIDDWVKYSHKWTDMGGIFILHKNAKQSLAELQYLLVGGSYERYE